MRGRSLGRQPTMAEIAAVAGAGVGRRAHHGERPKVPSRALYDWEKSQYVLDRGAWARGIHPSAHPRTAEGLANVRTRLDRQRGGAGMTVVGPCDLSSMSGGGLGQPARPAPCPACDAGLEARQTKAGPYCCTPGQAGQNCPCPAGQWPDPFMDPYSSTWNCVDVPQCNCPGGKPCVYGCIGWPKDPKTGQAFGPPDPTAGIGFVQGGGTTCDPESINASYQPGASKYTPLWKVDLNKQGEIFKQQC